MPVHQGVAYGAMKRLRDRLLHTVVCTIGLAYFSLTVWMHIWALETGVPRPGEPTKPHHQVCTWIGTSGEAGFVGCSPITLPTPVVSISPASPLQSTVLPIIPDTVRARAPPMLS
ncbi:MAG: hypothetical protein CV090_15355 [Nitrospira sp. WS238]|nr:hypothetical protein [Nitrospira sp. WS238]